jgi:UDP-2,3-diacylglucosamine hydrolase
MSEPASFFVADTHLEADQLDICAAFCDFLRKLAPEAEALYILGDFLEFYVGQDLPMTWADPVWQALSDLSNAGTKVYVMPGNRDFLMDQSFCDRFKGHYLPDNTVIDLYGKRTLLTHGDRWCIEDRAHQRFRRITDLSLLRKGFARLPSSVRQKMAERLRLKSKQKHRKRQVKDFDLDWASLLAFMQEIDCDWVIHGHTHQAKKLSHMDGSRERKRMVVSDWGEEYTYLKVTASDEKLITKHIASVS